jgi:hypothetical protein
MFVTLLKFNMSRPFKDSTMTEVASTYDDFHDKLLFKGIKIVTDD